MAGSGFGQEASRQAIVPSSPAPSRTWDDTLKIYGPGIIAIDATGNRYIAVPDGIIKIDAAGGETRIAGIPKDSNYSGDGGPALSAGLNARAIAVDAAGNIFLADTRNNRIREIATATGIITTIAGEGTRGFSGDGGLAVRAELNGPSGIALDSEGDVFFADGTRDGATRIRKVAAQSGVITTVAGAGSQGFSGDGGPAVLAQFHTLGGLAVDKAGNIYIADNFNNRIRMISASSGTVTTVVGDGVPGISGDGGQASEARLNNPLSVAVDTLGNLFIADSGNFRIRKVASGSIATIKASGAYGDTHHGFPCAVAVDFSGNIHVADSGASTIRTESGTISPDYVSRPIAQTSASGAGFKINVTYNSNVPAAAQAAFNKVASTYEGIFGSNVTANINVQFGNTDLGESDSELSGLSYSAWRTAMTHNATANPANSYAGAAAASLPASDPIGNGMVFLTTANARALGFTANTSVDSTITFSNSVTFEYTGTAIAGAADFLDTAAHELNEALGIGSELTGLQNNAPVPSGDYAAEDYFRYGGAGSRSITTNPNAIVYFSYDGGNANVAQFNQAYAAQGSTDLDRNDWIYGNFACPATTVYVQNAVACLGQAVVIGSGPEITVLNSLGYNPIVVGETVAADGVSPGSGSGNTQTFTFTFADTTGYNYISVVDVLINNYLDGQQACYFALVPANATSGYLYLVDDAGDGGYVSGSPLLLPSSSSLQNSQCILNGATSSISGSGNTLTLTIQITFSASFAGNRIFYMAARSSSQNSGWQALGTWNLPLASANGPAVAGMSPSRSSGSGQTYSFTFTDTNGYSDLKVLDVLINSFLDGVSACYFAYVPTGAATGSMYLVDNAGDGGYVSGSPVSLSSGASISNSQCTINTAGSSASATGNILTLNLSITFNSSFGGNQIFYAAARNNSGGNSGWQAIGSVSIP